MPEIVNKPLECKCGVLYCSFCVEN